MQPYAGNNEAIEDISDTQSQIIFHQKCVASLTNNNNDEIGGKSANLNTNETASNNNGIWTRYSEEICITREGPSRDCQYSSFVNYVADQNFKDEIFFEYKMVPYSYCSTLMVNEEDAVPLKYYEKVWFKPKLIPKKFVETVYSYPKEIKRHYVTTLTYDPDSCQRKYISGIRISVPNNELNVQVLHPGDVVTSEELSNVNGMSNGKTYYNGTNGIHDEYDKNCNINNNNNQIVCSSKKNVYESTKEIVINGTSSTSI